MATTTSPPPAPTPVSPTRNTTSTSTEDDFDTLLTLEDQFYNDGYNQGMADGLVAGRAEGRQLGLERGFQKFVESGRLQGRAIVWANRLQLGQARTSSSSSRSNAAASAVGGQDAVVGKGDEIGEGAVGGGKWNGEADGQGEKRLPPLPDNARLAKHVTTLYALVETESLSTENTDEAVDDFDDRLRRAQGRFKVIERMVGEGENGRTKGDGQGQGHDPGAAFGKGEGVDV